MYYTILYILLPHAIAKSHISVFLLIKAGCSKSAVSTVKRDNINNEYY